MKFSDFGFKENPFAITPDPRYLYLSRGHEESLAHLIYGTGPNGGFVLLTGEVGTGKTLLLRSLLAQQLESVDIALILNPRLSRREFLATICDELGIVYQGPPYSLKYLSDLLTRHLIQTHSAGRHTVLVVDEAQNLSPRVLEQVRLLTNLETSRHKLLRIILVGQPELQQMLARKELRQVDQRITARYHLSPLNLAETRSYITHRLAVAGVREDLFTPFAMRLVYRFSRGVPRLINTICERSLLALYTTGHQRATPRLVWQAGREVMGRKPSRRWGGALALGLGLVLVTALAWYGYTHQQASPEHIESRLPAVKSQPQVQQPSMSEPMQQRDQPELPGGMPEAGELASPRDAEAGVAIAPGSDEQSVADRGVLENASAPVAEPAASANTLEVEADPQPDLQPDRATVESNGPTEVDLLQLFSHPQNTFLIYQQLFHIWDADYRLDIAKPPCAQAPGYGLRCLVASASWETLMRMNRPMLIRLKQEQQERLLILTHVDDDWLLVKTGEGEGVVRRERLSPLWKGGFVMLWRPLSGLALIGQGSTGKAVTWLRERLEKVDGQVPQPPQGLDRFDQALKLRLQAFQRNNGLLEDGVAGQETQIFLNNLDLPDETPILQPFSHRGEG
ncbi:MAG: AAA family ATPase [Candidatus Thiodiazotropha sp.]